jgi:hypothetical protein
MAAFGAAARVFSIATQRKALLGVRAAEVDLQPSRMTVMQVLITLTRGGYHS